MPRSDQQAIGVPRWYDRVPMSKPYPQRSMRDDFGKSQIRRLDVTVTFDDLKIRRDLSEKIVGFFIRQVPQT